MSFFATVLYIPRQLFICCVQKYVAMAMLGFVWEQNQIFIEFELLLKFLWKCVLWDLNDKKANMNSGNLGVVRQ